MSTDPVVSIISAVYNSRPYLSRMVDSVLSQSFLEWELILVDDGSTDGSGQDCDAYAAKDSRIRVIHKQNGGVSSARNTALKAASGKFLYFADSDDILFPECLLVLLNTCGAPVDLVTASYERYEDDVLIPERIHQKEFCLTPHGYYDVISVLPNAHFCERYLWTKLFRRSIVVENHLQFDESLSYREDVFFLFNYVKCCRQWIIGINQPVYKYYRRSSGTAASVFTSVTPHTIDMFKSTYNCIRIWNQEGASSTAKNGLRRELIADYYYIRSLLNSFTDNNHLERCFNRILNKGLFYSLPIKKFIFIKVKDLFRPVYRRLRSMYL